MIRRPPRSTLSSSSAASDVYKRQAQVPPPGLTTNEQALVPMLPPPPIPADPWADYQPPPPGQARTHPLLPPPPPTVTAEAVGEDQVQLRILIAHEDAFDLLRSLTRVLLGHPDAPPSPPAADGTLSLAGDDEPTWPTPGVVVQCAASSVGLGQGGPVP